MDNASSSAKCYGIEALALYAVLFALGICAMGLRFKHTPPVLRLNVETQSQTTYTFRNQVPRFTPLPEHKHGVWRDAI
jgi:hypothetical protein